MRKPRDPKSPAKTKSAEPSAKDDLTKTSQEVSPATEPRTLTEPQDLEAPDLEAAAIDQTPADALADDESRHEDLPPDDLPHIDHAQDDAHGHRTFAATALMILIGVLFIASLTLWAAPKIAPYLPESLWRNWQHKGDHSHEKAERSQIPRENEIGRTVSQRRSHQDLTGSLSRDRAQGFDRTAGLRGA